MRHVPEVGVRDSITSKAALISNPNSKNYIICLLRHNHYNIMLKDLLYYFTNTWLHTLKQYCSLCKF